MNTSVIESFDKFAEQYANFTFNNILQFELNKFISLIDKNSKILDLGCGSGRDVQYLLDYKYDVLGIDASKNLITEAKKRVKGKFEVMDMLDLKFKNEFNGVWAQDSISYLSKDEIVKVFGNVYNVLKKDGVFFVSVREGKDQIIITHDKLGKEDLLVSFFEKKELEKLLKKFEIIESYTQEGEDFSWINVFCKKA